MATTTHDIRQSLLAADVEFRRLAEEHSRCESQLEQILNQPYLSSEDLLHEVALKKFKLRLKDQMELIVARHQHQPAHC
ncbi:MAG: YdcH family protein [Candidatus Acidiferrales bacterium]